MFNFQEQKDDDLRNALVMAENKELFEKVMLSQIGEKIRLDMVTDIKAELKRREMVKVQLFKDVFSHQRNGD